MLESNDAGASNLDEAKKEAVLDRKVVRASVRGIVEFLMQSGSIDNRRGGGSVTLLQEGVRIHSKFQRKRKNEAQLQDAVYESEVRLSFTLRKEKYDFVSEGRADGIFTDASGNVYIEEIKSTVAPLEYISEDGSPWHWGQAKCYAHMLCNDRPELENVFVKIIYISVETEEALEFVRCYSRTELKLFYDELIEKYLVWVDMDINRKEKRNKSIKSCGFPYDAYRKGQRDFAVMAYRAIERGKNLYIEAPTGTGKTISALFPAVKALGENLCDKFFYLTAKTITRQAAENALLLMKKKGYCLSCVTLTAKEKICITGNSAENCNPNNCCFANGHYDRIADAVMDIVSNCEVIGREDVLAYARKHTVCPHEYQLDISNWTDGVVCDYNYVFDPKIQLKRFFGDMAKKECYALLIDEAHNLVERARDMFSSAVTRSMFDAAGKAIESREEDLYRLLRNIVSYFTDISERIPDGKSVITTRNEPNELYRLLSMFTEQADIWFAQSPVDVGEEFLTAYFSAIEFMRTSERYDERFVVYIESAYDVTVKLLCLDPSYLLSLELSKAKGSVFFSATLTPASYFRQVLGGAEDDFIVRLPSPYNREKLCVIIENRISTRYKDREKSYERIADRIYDMISARRGNYFAFFSSYAYLTQVHSVFAEKYPDETVLIQGRDLGETEREAFLARFDAGNKDGLVAFAVMGGIFSEGIDLLGDRLIGAAIIGVGLPLISEERDVILRYYDCALKERRISSNGSGYDFAYIFPGMNKVLQAAGRVIRSEDDKGVIMLIDDRFISSRYLALFPHEWRGFVAAGNTDVKVVLENFWGGDANAEKED